MEMDDIVQEVLLHLPPKSLGRCKILSKKWYAYISRNHSFRQTYLSKNSSGGMMLGFFFCKPLGDVEFLPTSSQGRTSNNMLIPLDGSLSFLENEKIYIHGSSNGYLLYGLDTCNSQNYFICNPINKQWVDVPPTPPNGIGTERINHGFIFLVTTTYPRLDKFHHYILVNALKSDDYSTTLKVELLSTKESPEWKSMDLTAPVSIKLIRKWYGNAVVTEHGVIYWLAAVLGRDGYISVVVFDPSRSSSSLEIIESPCEPHENLKLFGMSGTDILFGTCDYGFLKIWLLNEFIELKDGVECLTRKWSLRHFADFVIPREYHICRENHRLKYIRFVGFHPLNPKIVFVHISEHLFLFDIPKARFELVYYNEEAAVGQWWKCYVSFPYTYGLIGPPLFHDD